MKRSLPKRSNLFLMEMILAILFFSLSSAVCMQLFVAARVLSRDTSARNHAIILAKSAASAFETGDGSLESLQGTYPLGRLEDSVWKVYYDKNWESCEKNDSSYEMHIAIKEQNGNLTTAVIQVFSDESELFSLNASSYQPEKAVIE